jgi:hypothetical protein
MLGPKGVIRSLVATFLLTVLIAMVGIIFSLVMTPW